MAVAVSLRDLDELEQAAADLCVAGQPAKSITSPELVVPSQMNDCRGVKNGEMSVLDEGKQNSE